MLYRVRYGELRKTWYNMDVLVEANDEEEAKQKALNGEYKDVINIEENYCESDVDKTVFNPEDGDYIKEIK